MLAVSVLPQRADVRPDLVHEDLPLTRLRHVNHLLHHVVGVLVLHHRVQGGAGAVRVGGAHLFDQEGSLGPVGVLDALLHHIAGEFML